MFYFSLCPSAFVWVRMSVSSASSVARIAAGTLLVLVNIEGLQEKKKFYMIYIIVLYKNSCLVDRSERGSVKLFSYFPGEP